MAYQNSSNINVTGIVNADGSGAFNGGYLQATQVGDSIEIVALAANELYVVSSVGNWTVV